MKAMAPKTNFIVKKTLVQLCFWVGKLRPTNYVRNHHKMKYYAKDMIFSFARFYGVHCSLLACSVIK